MRGSVEGCWRLATAWLTTAALLALACGGGPPITAGQPVAADPVTVYLVRHAEKATTDEPDPPLTAAGEARALALAELLAGMPIGSVIASEFRRTQETVAPLAHRLGLEVEVVEAAAGEELAARLRAAAPGTRAVIAGHSNTVPQLIAALGVEERFEIPDQRYGDLFVVRLAGGKASLERLRFGD